MILSRDKLTASEAIYGFAGWLASRRKQVVLSACDDAMVMADLITQFCAVNHLAEPRRGWGRYLVQPAVDGASQ